MKSEDMKQSLEEGKIVLLEDRVKRLEKQVRILETVVGRIAKANGIEVEIFQDGLVIIS